MYTAREMLMAFEDRAALIESFVLLAYHLASKYHHWSLGVDDLFQAAVVSVIESVDAYDPSSSVPLVAFVAQRIRWELSHEIDRAKRRTNSARDRRRQVEMRSGGFAEAREYEAVDELYDAIEELPDDDRRILTDYFGLDGAAPLSRSEVAIKRKRSIGAISSSSARSIRRLRSVLSA
jgi:RNA polymerase sigma factor (sigma-70 family)